MQTAFLLKHKPKIEKRKYSLATISDGERSFKPCSTVSPRAKVSSSVRTVTFGNRLPLQALLLFLWRTPLIVPNCIIKICLAGNGQFICITTFRPYTKQTITGMKSGPTDFTGTDSSDWLRGEYQQEIESVLLILPVQLPGTLTDPQTDWWTDSAHMRGHSHSPPTPPLTPAEELTPGEDKKLATWQSQCLDLRTTDRCILCSTIS